MDLADITSVSTHLAIGTPRLGNSPKAHRRIERQAARADRWTELTDLPGEAAAHWTVHVANRKAASLIFTGATPQQGGGGLVIDPGAWPLRRPGERHLLDGGRFARAAVPLGELRTDDAGQLLVLGGTGVAGSPTREPCTAFADSDGWWDDTWTGP
ncbi:LodA/GoxA family CTQ-dependent oxidase [Streptomyces flavidovirens]|uniref:LodA/GoxA family CTQ-dependent oxidase n=1 Tax=Streptomyces flavidovirens TaxID=67298 RepID=UPI000422E4E5|nr:LodA/GoxA family CTQ-dependent oxidase [Streptomyces flavidovirens]